MTRPTCHDGDYRAQQFGPTTWREEGRWDGGVVHTCSFCGSLRALDLLAFLDKGSYEESREIPVREETVQAYRAEGMTPPDPDRMPLFRWADWKYGYPHKLYVDPMRDLVEGAGKFYTKHLADEELPRTEMFQLADHLGRLTGLRVWTEIEDGRADLHWKGVE